MAESSSSSAAFKRHGAGGSSSSSGIMAAMARFWQRSYAPDYLGLAIITTLYVLLRLFVEPFHRMFTLDNVAIQFPHAEIERVPPGALLLYGGIAPLAALLAWFAVARPGTHKVHVTLLGLFSSVFLTVFVTDVIKNAVGRPRPDLLARCKPRDDTSLHALVSVAVCTETEHHRLHDGWRSFPSGHSSFAFSGLAYLAFFLASQLHALRPGTDLLRMLVVMAPLLGALMIAISRCEDYRHDVWDVTAGSTLGFGIAYATFRRYYPALSARDCHAPYPNPADGGPGGFNGIRGGAGADRMDIGLTDYRRVDDMDGDLETGLRRDGQG